MRYLYLLFLYIFQIKLIAFDLTEMSLEEKVGQLFMVYFEGERVNENSTRLLKEAKVGGIILYNWANRLDSPQQVQNLCFGLQQDAFHYVGIPLLIAADQEGGLKARLEEGFTEFPGNAALGRSKNPNLAFKVAYAIGKEMRSVGVNFNFAPVVDINKNPKNPIIGIRSFGGDPEIVTEFGRKSVEGYQSAGVISCLKHFPGHGDVTVDSHKELPVVSKSLSQLLAMELYPFVHLAQEVPAIMTSHILFSQIDPNHCATLSTSILNGILRDKFKFQGILVTDSLAMQGALKGYKNLEQVVFKAIEAGNDILLIGGRDLQNKMDGETNVDEIIRIFHNVVHAVRTGVISEDRINQSVRRIINLKEKYGLFTVSSDLSQSLHSEAHQNLAREIAYRALFIKEWLLQEDLSSKQVLVVAPKIIEAKVRKSGLSSLGKFFDLYFFTDIEPKVEEYKEVLDRSQYADVVIFCSYNAWKISEQRKLLTQLAGAKSTICIALCDPYDLDILNQSLIKIATFSPTACSLNIVTEYLQRQTVPFKVSATEAQAIGNKIWYNECKNREDQLTFWHEKELFPSMGIGHFIWPPSNYNGPFSEGRFHKFIHFAKAQRIEIPSWLLDQPYSPWTTREAFYQDFDTEKMKELRSFLLNTVSIQAKYMVESLNSAFLQIVLGLPPGQRQTVINNFFDVGSSSNGLYILVDYLNFKHEGTDLKERYKGKGWGLMQVLQEMDQTKTINCPQKAFADSAKVVLSRRIENSPNQDIERTRFDGWINRLSSYYKE